MASKNNNKILQEAFKPLFKANGFKKRRDTWHHTSDDLIKVFNIQGSQWSEYFYFNIGLYLRALGDEERPLEYSCHVRLRLELLLPDKEEISKLHELSDFEKEQPMEERTREIAAMVEKAVFPWFARFSETRDVIRYYESDSEEISFTREFIEYAEKNHA